MNVIECAQGTTEWLQARAGKVTASRIKDVMAKGKSGEAATRRNYRAQLVAETLTGMPQEQAFVSAEMKWGTEQEPYARAAYEVRTGRMVDQLGLVIHPTIELGAASPDGITLDHQVEANLLRGMNEEEEDKLRALWMKKGMAPCEGLIEIKCPNTATHLDYLIANEVPADYQPQMLWQMACTGAQWCDFISFDPRLPEKFQLFVKRFHRDEARIATMEAEVRQFLSEVAKTIEQLQGLAA